VRALYGLYPDGPSAQQADNRLKAAGLADAAITVMSSQPMDGFEFGRRDRATWMWWLACGGGLAGLVGGLGLSWITETWWTMDVGGLPTFAWWPNIIIVFELTMLGAILTTVATLVLTAGLGRRSRLYDPAVSHGRILVGVDDPAAGTVDDLRAALAAAGGEIKTIEQA
jgi:hypothetical protein